MGVAASTAAQQMSTGMHLAPSLTDDVQDTVAAAYALLQLRPVLNVSNQDEHLAACTVADGMIALIQVSFQADFAAPLALTLFIKYRQGRLVQTWACDLCF